MASPAAGRDVPNAPPREELEPSDANHPEPACQEAQKWIEVSEVAEEKSSGPAATAQRGQKWVILWHTVTGDINIQPCSPTGCVVTCSGDGAVSG